MCKFCNNWELEDIVQTKGWTVSLTNDEMYINVEIDFGEAGILNFDTAFTIKYCPVCGRKLMDEDD